MNNELCVVVNNDNTNVSVIDTINAISNAKFKHVFVQWYDKDLEISQLEQVKLCQKLGLNIDFAHLGYQTINEIWQDCGEYLVDRYKKNILDCHNLGIDMVLIHASSKWDAPEPNELGLDRYRRILDYAKSLNVKVAIENTKVTKHIEYLFDNLNYDNLGICFDAGHYHCNSKDNWDVSKYVNRVFCVHLHDNDGNDDLHLLPFDGDNNWNRIIEVLDYLNYDGPITMELCYRKKYNEISIDEFYKEGYKRGEQLVKLRSEFMTHINDENLSKVAGGESNRKEKTVVVDLQFQETSSDKTIKVYVDGQIDRALCTTIDGMVTHKTFMFKGYGIKSVRFKVNDLDYKDYTIDFESGTYY